MNLLLALGLPLLIATQSFAQPCQVTGTVAGLGSRPITFEYQWHGVAYTDTVRAVRDHFTYTAKPSDSGLVTLRLVRSPYTHFWVEPGKLTVTGDIAQPDKLTITGTPENNATDEYNHTVDWKYDVMAAPPTARAAVRAQNGQATIQFIKKHLAVRTSANLLYWQSLYDEKPLAEYEQLAKQLTPAVQRSPQGQQLAKRLLLLRNQPVVGRPVPAFTIADTAGVPVSLAAYRGHYVLLDFWGHWCGPCIESVPELRTMHAQYANKLTVIGLAMEDASDAAVWKRTIRKHQVPGVQVSELQQADGPTMKGYNITAFPTYMLLDRQGTLVLRTNNLADITKKLPTLADLQSY